jgi:hypothetical protein
MGKRVWELELGEGGSRIPEMGMKIGLEIGGNRGVFHRAAVKII